MSRNNKHWTQEELDFVKENAKTMTPDVIAHHLGRTDLAVKLAAKSRGIKLYKQRTGGLKDKVGDTFIKWSAEEDHKLWAMCERFSLQQIADHLGRTRGAVFNRCKKLGIRLRQGKRTNTSIAKDLGFTPDVFRKYKKRCGLTFLTYNNPRNPTYEELRLIVNSIASNPNSYQRFSKSQVLRAIEKLVL